MDTPDTRVFRIATRESRLALWQANFVADSIRHHAPGSVVELVPMSTVGDRDRIGSLQSFGGQGVFTREVQRAVLDGHADLAVHSLKDLPTVPTPGLVLAGVPKRAPRFDVLLLPDAKKGTIDDLPTGARVGSGSPRRQSQLLRIRPDLQLMEIRGNVETRISKLDGGEFDAIILAEAGLRRLQLEDRISQILRPPLLYPAVGQAALGIECRDDDQELIDILARISDRETFLEVRAERSCLYTLKAGCHAPVGLISTIHNDLLTLDVVILSLDGRQLFQASASGPLTDPEEIGRQAAQILLEQGASALL
jgi:porphobilinogen deaminase